MLTSATSLSTKGNSNLPPTGSRLQVIVLILNPVRLGLVFCTSLARHSHLSSTFLFCEVAKTATTVTLTSSPAPHAGARTMRMVTAKKAARELRVEIMANTQFRELRVMESSLDNYLQLPLNEHLFVACSGRRDVHRRVR